ncbi:hypothetical protein EJ05DRAFT_461345 [Pseudovirgaria hyperparasitica]|uniref:Oxysterol-binding protein-like protein n=1 Tax=Pseudovirgaria hyperparasitica TaxID=470096 RepID=A0A6A6WD64_9PEZI|nr:uncharacterized protein EJ05DRAFT_461345 [Pseudovirgaria hyperparasitica]KAF2760772.1 hypothetical protein EJ05DRAFT_461345 [Pseudovirgaria hyperparasitica]
MSEPTPSVGAPDHPTNSAPASASSSKQPSRETTPVPAGGEKPPDEQGKLRLLLGILRKFLGVADISAVRFSLPAQLMEPIPNLEYWNYMDRPEAFASIGDSEDPLGRMLGCLRFWFTKDLKYVKGKPCKPYNSTLGEFFRCNWEVEDNLPALKYKDEAPSGGPSGKTVKVSFLTEQTSHHPPVSAWWVDCEEKGIIARGYDQLSAKFTGTSIKVIPGNHNEGIFINLTKRDNEQYKLTHPAAFLGGLIRGSLSISVADTCTITCAKTKIKTILTYLEEGWLGKAQNKVEGVVFKYDPENDNCTKVKDVPDKDVLARIEGCWQDKVYYSLGSQPFAKSKEKILLLDVNPLFPAPKLLPPQEKQLTNESRRFWQAVTDAIVSKQFSQATTLKVEIEEKQREKAAERKTANIEWTPRFFTGAVTPAGKPELTPEGEKVMKGLHEGTYDLEESTMLGA